MKNYIIIFISILIFGSSHSKTPIKKTATGSLLAYKNTFNYGLFSNDPGEKKEHNYKFSNYSFTRHPYRNTFIGNTLGTLFGGLLGAGLTQISDEKSKSYSTGDPENIDKVILGLYIGAIIGGSMGSPVGKI